MEIITLTLNPAFDKHCKTNSFQLGHESFFEVTSLDVGGKGINISRALKNVNINSKAIIVLGNNSKDEFLEALSIDNLDYKIIETKGKVRENIILHDNSNIETRVSFNGSEIDDSILSELENILFSYPANSIITLTGSNPLGIDNNKVKELAIKLTKKGYKLIVDNRSFSLADLIEIKPYLIKPNIDEFQMYLNKKIDSLDKLKIESINLINKGIENVIISLGNKGAILVNKGSSYYAKANNIDVISTIGAGDSMIAGFIYSKLNNCNDSECLKYAVAFGSAKCLEYGTNPPKKENIDKLFENIKIKEI